MIVKNIHVDDHSKAMQMEYVERVYLLYVLGCTLTGVVPECMHIC